jgi:hypothetical protein
MSESFPSTPRMNTLNNGRYTENKTGEQGWQEAERQDCLQRKACETDGGSPREKRDYIVTIENASQFKHAFIIKQVSTAKELFEKVCDLHLGLCHDSIVMRVSDSRIGSLHRVYYEQDLPKHTDSLFIHLSLRKHTPFYGCKIEKQ